jgi:predicted secreted protein
MPQTTKVILPMGVATASVLIGGVAGGPKAPRSNMGVIIGAFFATFILAIFYQYDPSIASGLALLAMVSALLIYGPSIATAVNNAVR